MSTDVRDVRTRDGGASRYTNKFSAASNPQ